ncbi:hypothetical protein GCM10022197_32430 [Microlunatus spumicola]|uniref:GmrSD restriction endonucleases N-terminal domain-containing protein n=1 Tax=Microlunatus spumicola TaxID=81499 RepID=A0ABP6XVN0_9ACTN
MDARTMALDKVYKRRNRYDIPEWQRDEVWSTERKQLLIDSILRGWKLPKLYFARTSEDPVEYEVVDGQQRLSAIFEFMDGTLELPPDSAARHGAAGYQELPETASDAFDDFEIEYDEITEASDGDLQTFFQRLQGGMQLTAAERLNSVAGNLTKFARSLAKHPFFTAKVSIKDTRKAYFDIASKALSIEVDTIDVGLRYDDLKAVFEANNLFSEKSNVALLLFKTLGYLNDSFPSKSPVLRNRSTIQSTITLAAKIVQTGKAGGTEELFRAFMEKFGSELASQVELGQKATDHDYLDFQRTLSANVKVGPKRRHEILVRKMLLFDPEWIEVLGASALQVGSMEKDIARLTGQLEVLVSTKNDEYSAKYGHDFFKATNKTAGAMSHIRTPILDFDQYTTLISDLYFIFREAAGQRLTSVPSSFEDVNLLRTGLQHDVDHGKPGAVAAKKKKIGQAFKKYSASSASPATLAPAKFPIVQAALLQALVSDLDKLDVLNQ